MKSTVNNWLKMLKKYEQNHPVLIMIWTALAVILIVAVILVAAFTFYYFKTSDKQYVQFGDQTFSIAINELYGGDHYTEAELQDVSTLEITGYSELTDISDYHRTKPYF